jgi:hypothetical protein
MNPLAGANTIGVPVDGLQLRNTIAETAIHGSGSWSCQLFLQHHLFPDGQ